MCCAGRSLGVLLLLASAALATGPAQGGDEPFAALAREYASPVQGVIKTYCLDCHSTAAQEGDFDLERFGDLTAVRRDPRAWQQVAEMLDNGEMPPKEADQPTADERKQLRDWVARYLDAEARAGAGDPGDVILRRLSNAEYRYTVRDLTGFDLDPGREFPVDGAAGEGFTNTGQSLVMSPALLTKYLDAAKQVASHAVLLPDGFRFSPGESRRDWSNELIDEIRAIYARHVDDEGRVPLEPYLRTLHEQRGRLAQGETTAAEVAAAAGLNGRYLDALRQALEGQEASLVLDPLRKRWRAATADDLPALIAEIAAWQQLLFRFNNVGHFKPWMEAVAPLPESVTLKRPLPAETGGEVTLYLAAIGTDAAANDGPAVRVVWHSPRFEAPGRPPLLLRDVRRVAQAMPSVKKQTLSRTADYLSAVAEIDRAADSDLTSNVDLVETIAQRRDLNVDLLRQWLAWLGIQSAAPEAIGEYLATIDRAVSGYAPINGWSAPGLPALAANSSDQEVKIPGVLPARSVAVHPTPERAVAVAWFSPLAGAVSIRAEVADAHDACGNGVRWSLELHRGGRLESLGAGVIDNGAAAAIAPIERVQVGVGDRLLLTIGARDNDHVCDLTRIELAVTELDVDAADARHWSLADDVTPDVLAGNPHADRLGNPAVWHFVHHRDTGVTKVDDLVPAGSALAAWREQLRSGVEAEKLSAGARRIEELLGGDPPGGGDSDDGDSADARLYAAAHLLSGPLWGGVDLARVVDATPKALPPSLADDNPDSQPGLDASRFGAAADGSPAAVDAGDDDLVVAAGETIELRLPLAVVGGRELVVAGALDATSPEDAAVQLALTDTAPPGILTGVPFITRAATIGRQRVEAGYEFFRQAFPPTMCYRRIVPVDEVITLVLYHREDDALVRLMLDEAETARLDHLWSELRWVSQDALKIQEAYGQFMEYATQDNDPSLFEPLREPIQQRADELERALASAEPRQLARLLEFAERAYRRPLADAERAELLALYQSLRQQQLPHDEAFRLTLARVLVSPSFLYRVELPAPGDAPSAVSDWELAVRLSYFLWASMPDDELLRLAAAGQLREPDVLRREARRLLADERVRGLSTEFACQWIDIPDFAANDEKSEQHFPTFHALRGDMQEEAIRFFADLFQRDGSVLEALDADHVFVNGPLAAHYGIEGVEGPQWRRVDGVKRLGRGGVLAMSAPLAMQSGASRTSPILRGNWIVESLLGERLPKPPKNVPLLPDDETETEGLTVRQLVERHRSVAECAVCHMRIDPFGFALEGYDAIGRARETDLGGRPIDVRSQLADGRELAGLDGLRDYLVNQRRDDFLRTFCKKLLGYALGRGVSLSDEPLMDDMRKALERRDYRVSAAIDVILDSRQFREHRGRDLANPHES